jgi:hypothetical protein
MPTSCPQEGECFVLEYLGFVTDVNSGQTAISFRVTNKCKYATGYIAIGTDAFTRIAPADGSTYAGNLGTYEVSWTRTTGNPGFVSVKFESRFDNFNNGASDLFVIVVSNFNPNTTIQVQGHAGSATDTFNFLLSTPCPPSGPTLATQSLGDVAEWLSGSGERLLGWLGPAEKTPSLVADERVARFAPGLAPASDNLPALSRDGSLNWQWFKESSKQRADNIGR